MLKVYPNILILILTLMACSKDCYKYDIAEPLPDEMYYKFEIVEVNYHCIDYFGRKAVKMICVQAPLGLEQLYRSRFPEIVYTSLLPHELMEVGKVIRGRDIIGEVDWREKLFCARSGEQLALVDAEIDY